MNTSLSKVALITGGAGLGIGHGLSEALAAAGWNLVIADRDATTATALAERLNQTGITVEVVPVDVTAPEAPTQAVAAALKRFGRLDALVNSAAVGLLKKAGEVSDEEFQTLFNVNFFAAFRFVRAALPALIQTQGAIVNIGSVHTRLAAADYALYAATKAALDAFTRGLAVDYGAQGVRANIVHPGLVASPQNGRLFTHLGVDPAQWVKEFILTKQCLPDLVSAREVGELVTFLLSQNARTITGQSIYIDAGTTTLLWNKTAPP